MVQFVVKLVEWFCIDISSLYVVDFIMQVLFLHRSYIYNFILAISSGETPQTLFFLGFYFIREKNEMFRPRSRKVFPGARGTQTGPQRLIKREADAEKREAHRIYVRNRTVCCLEQPAEHRNGSNGVCYQGFGSCVEREERVCNSVEGDRDKASRKGQEIV
ncbi:uncharacterized protein LALA0_S01e17040g [Lachancea lanzarotensis]|uniref:LALA0S01e17040g1_1 n=1 Tax=Lachancea lanzarotensis TaxID=1245769 RepID=A0A0C7N2B6_9SACH|nr:uncharacterized protein LALA0_S01e17040g [Lachancea lanzarotensis]CEP60704.1 LALA0S01e17040g1_1 [Lachancea lanzarotensis]